MKCLAAALWLLPMLCHACMCPSDYPFCVDDNYIGTFCYTCDNWFGCDYPTSSSQSVCGWFATTSSYAQCSAHYTHSHTPHGHSPHDHSPHTHSPHTHHPPPPPPPPPPPKPCPAGVADGETQVTLRTRYQAPLPLGGCVQQTQKRECICQSGTFRCSECLATNNACSASNDLLYDDADCTSGCATSLAHGGVQLGASELRYERAGGACVAMPVAQTFVCVGVAEGGAAQLGALELQRDFCVLASNGQTCTDAVVPSSKACTASDPAPPPPPPPPPPGVGDGGDDSSSSFGSTTDLLVVGGAGAAVLGLIAFLASYALSPERAQSLAVVVEAVAGVLPGSWKKGALAFAAKLTDTAETQLRERREKRDEATKAKVAAAAAAAAATGEASGASGEGGKGGKEGKGGDAEGGKPASSSVRVPLTQRLRDAVPTVRVVAGDVAGMFEP